MRTKLVLSLCLCGILCGAEPITLGRLMVGPQKIYINVTGIPDPNASWSLRARTGTQAPAISVPVTHVEWLAAAGKISLEFDPAPLSGRDPRRFGWTATYNNLLAVTLKPPAPLFGVAKSKEDADLYLFGSYLAGVSTKPLYAIDATLAWLPEVRESGYFLGVASTIAVNSTSSSPADRTEVDPDAISAGMTLRFIRRDFRFDIQPARGEFARRYPATSFVPSATVKWIAKPLFDTPRQAVVFYPSAGIEAGANVNTSETIFGQPANLSNYTAIARLLFRAYAAYYIAKSDPDEDDPYLFEFYADYTVRRPFTDEPFITTQSLNGIRQPVLRVDSDIRQYIEAGIAWNVSKRVGLEAKYKHGSLPPLFEFLDHQVSVGVTFKTKLPAHL